MIAINLKPFLICLVLGVFSFQLHGQKIKEFSADGQEYGVGEKMNNKKEGLWRFYSASDQLLRKGEYEDGLLEGKWIYYYPSGKLYAKIEYERNEAISYTDYFETGAVRLKGSFNKGKKAGTWTTFYINGIRRKIETYYEGERRGLVQEFTPNRQLVIEEDYSADTTYGSW